MRYKNLITGISTLMLTNLAYSAVPKFAPVPPAALKAALKAYRKARFNHKLGSNKQILTVVDFSLPSYKKRLWVIDLNTHRVLMNLYTTQGKHSGLVYATHFSNRLHSKESSLGLFTTAGEYYGHHGLSMRLRGLEPGVNDHAEQRAVVIHSAWYATNAFVQQHHRTGRSWGCFAVSPTHEKRLLTTIRGGSALYAYAATMTNRTVHLYKS